MLKNKNIFNTFPRQANVAVFAEGILKKQIDFIDCFFCIVNKKGLSVPWHNICLHLRWPDLTSLVVKNRG